MRKTHSFKISFLLLGLTACQSDSALNSFVESESSAQAEVQTIDQSISHAQALPTLIERPAVGYDVDTVKQSRTPTANNIVPTASPLRQPDVQAYKQVLDSQPGLQQPIRPRTRKTYLINGLLSAVPFIGFGFRNLHQKLPEAQLHSYISPLESSTIILPKVLREIEQAYAADPNVSINLIGISLGADFITIVAERLNEKNIPVNYLGIVDGTNLRPITPNVVKADNLTCTYLDCTRAKARLAKGNVSTILQSKKYRSSHIPLGNNAELHARVIAQSRS